MILAAVLAAAVAGSPLEFAQAECGFESGTELQLTASPASKAFRRLAAYRRLPFEERDSFRLAHAFSENDAAQLCAFLQEESSNARIMLARAGDRYFAPVDEALILDRATLTVAAANGASPSVEVILSPTSAPNRIVGAAELVRGAVQTDRFVRRNHGIIGWIVPGIHGARFEWDGAAPTAEAVFANGEKAALPVYFNTAEFMPLKDKSLRRAVRLEFGRAPSRIVFGP